MPENFDEPIVQYSLGAPVGAFGLVGHLEGDKSSLWVTSEINLYIYNFAEFAEVIVQLSNIVQASRNFFQFKRTIGRIMD